jgi:hypothetical protein
MILLLALGFLGLVVLATILFFLLRNKSSTNGGGPVKAAADGSVPANASALKEEVPAVSATVVGEKANDVISSGYFAAVYPGTQVVTKPVGTSTAVLPKSTPAFLLLTDQSGTIASVDANTAYWAAPVSNTAPAPIVKPTQKNPKTKSK